jgi:hypothetical protein
MQAAAMAKPPVGIVFDADMGNSIDDALSLALLYGFESKTEARVVSLSTTKSTLKSAAFLEAMQKFFFGRPVPVGMPESGKDTTVTPMLNAVVDKYPNTIKQLNDTADPAPVIRNSFTAQHDQNCIVLLAGPATNLASALALPGVKELAAAKVYSLMVVADEGLRSDVPALRKVLSEWSGPITFCGSDVGDQARFPGKAWESDAFAWVQPPGHPVMDAYRAFKSMPYDAASTAIAAALHAVRPHEKYFGVSDPGTMSVSEEGQLKFTPASGGKHQQLVFDPAQKERVLRTYLELVSIKPTQRGFRRPS